jgi:hypothetical protein
MMCERATYRTAHGSRLADKGVIRAWIADSAAELSAARLMTLHAAWKMDTDGAKAARTEISMIKFYGATVLHRIVDRALQVHGSLGYSPPAPRWSPGPSSPAAFSADTSPHPAVFQASTSRLDASTPSDAIRGSRTPNSRRIDRYSSAAARPPRRASPKGWRRPTRRPARRWREKDSNLRRLSQRIYSPSPLTARESRQAASSLERERALTRRGSRSRANASAGPDAPVGRRHAMKSSWTSC